MSDFVWRSKKGRPRHQNTYDVDLYPHAPHWIHSTVVCIWVFSLSCEPTQQDPVLAHFHISVPVCKIAPHEC